ncbi:MAG: excinuclease ABC subunit UvrB [Methermicoccaceae archaeon]
MQFALVSNFEPKGDQQQAIDALVDGVQRAKRHQTLLGVTGSGKTFTMANVIARVQRPTLVITHNKTLAAQLYSEFKGFFPHNAVEYFVSYYDYYQPEAYIPQTDTYIEKDLSINEEIERLRLSATTSVLTRRDTIVVASVSCIYGLGKPEDWERLSAHLKVKEQIDLRDFKHRLVHMQYERNPIERKAGAFRVRGDVVEVFGASEREGIRIELLNDEVERIVRFEPLTGKVIESLNEYTIYPAKPFIIPEDRINAALASIELELEDRLKELSAEGRLLEAQRLNSRTGFDMEMIREVGHCKGIENYSRHFDGRSAGEPPYTLLDYFPEDFLVFIDESHVMLPQLRAMQAGDHSRKKALVEYGFRLESAFDNRPLTFDEFMDKLNQVIYVSATPSTFELSVSDGVVEQLIRPTGLVDPEVMVKPRDGQIDDLVEEIRCQQKIGGRVLITTLTKRMAEGLTEYLNDLGIRSRYMHSDIDTLERTEIIRELRLGSFDVLVGINLLREGLDIPEVSLVAILDADVEGFLRSEVALIQTIGRASRNASSRVVMYADRTTPSMKAAIDETRRRRTAQTEYNRTHNITPRSIIKALQPELYAGGKAEVKEKPAQKDVHERLVEIEAEMMKAAEQLEFERAAELRDEMLVLRRTHGY